MDICINVNLEIVNKTNLQWSVPASIQAYDSSGFWFHYQNQRFSALAMIYKKNGSAKKEYYIKLNAVQVIFFAQYLSEKNIK